MMHPPLNGATWQRRGTYAYSPAPEGAKVLAPAPSYVERIWSDPEFGLCIRVVHMDGSRSVFVRLGTVDVGETAVLEAGDVIGTVGRFGAQGFAVEWHAWTKDRKEVNPVDWLFSTRAGRVVLGGILVSTIGGILLLASDYPSSKK